MCEDEGKQLRHFLTGEWHDLMFTLGSPLSGNLDKRLKGPKSVGRKAVQETMATVQVKVIMN